jgi:hypothetical protein
MKSLLFSSEMVRAILAGTKTQTRRIVKDQFPPQPDGDSRSIESAMYHSDRKLFRVGSIIYVRETFALSGPLLIFYKANSTDIENAGLKGMYNFKWTPSIYMPKELSRIALKITAIRVERLQNISESDAIAEGVNKLNMSFMQSMTMPILYQNYSNTREIFNDGLVNPIESYQTLWEKINGQGSWALNPLVYAITFEVLEHAPCTYH